MKSQSKSNDSPLPDRSWNINEKPHKEKCHGKKKRTSGAGEASGR